MLVAKLYNKLLTHRYDDDHIIKYFSAQDFAGLEAEPISFKTEKGLTLKGNIYSYPKYDKNNLIIFSHGIGGGHRSYMREIERIAREGYRVVAYDNIGCFESEGDGIMGLAESLHDLDLCLKWIKAQDEFKGVKLHVIGHSWGGYAASNILNYHPDVASVCVLAGFASPMEYMNSLLGGKLKWLQKKIYKLEQAANPDYVESSAFTALESAKAKVLVIHSKDDPMIKYDYSAALLEERVHNDLVSYYVVDGKKHNPNYTQTAVERLNGDLGAYRNLVAQKKLKTFEQKKAYVEKLDFWAMTEQDEAVWAEIFKLWK